MRVTVCVGGSILAPNGPDVECISEIAKALAMLKSDRHEVLVVTGGGGTARVYIEAGKQLNLSSSRLDMLGIDVTRLNARMLIMALGDLAEPEPVKTFEDAIQISLRNKIPVMGGTMPGQTTDAVAAMLAKASASDLLIFISDVDGIYTTDPKRDPSARKIERMTNKELAAQFGLVKGEPGMRTPVDPVAARIIERLKVRTVFIGKGEIRRLREIVRGEPHSGTTVVPLDD
ncbi:MAG: UMP kinase [Candidatus Hadarchaeales archaeon]